ncbi:MAG TPA: hypothetical protein VG650_02750 [Mycobacteriales bacterium]|nr:hypothetical protein [Mycobacteriales bacterium]
MKTQRDLHEDGGAVLILALLFILVVGLVGGALVGFAGSSLSQTSALSNDRAQTYAAESAMQVSINQLRTGATTASGTVGYQTPITCPTVAVPVNGTTYQVMCIVGQSPAPWLRSITFAACPSTSNCISGQSTYTPVVGSSAVMSVTTVFDDLDGSKGCTTHVEGADNCFKAGDSVDITGWDLATANN